MTQDDRPSAPGDADSGSHPGAGPSGGPGPSPGNGQATAGPEQGDEPTDQADEDLSPAIVGGGPPHVAPPKRTGVFVDADDLRNHVGDLLRAYLGGYQVDAWGNFTFTFDHARIFVTVPMTPIGPQVGIFSITNVEVDLTPELAGFLLKTNHQLGFGSFSFDEENRAVWLRHTLLGTTLDAPELQAAVAAIASTAAHFDDLVRDRFGGRTFHDIPEDAQNATKPPEPTGIANASGYL